MSFYYYVLLSLTKRSATMQTNTKNHDIIFLNITAIRCTFTWLFHSSCTLKRFTQFIQYKKGKGNTSVIQTVFYEHIKPKAFKYCWLQTTYGSVEVSDFIECDLEFFFLNTSIMSLTGTYYLGWHVTNRLPDYTQI